MDIKGKAGCPLCNGTGYKQSSWGTPVICDCVVEHLNQIETQITTEVSGTDIVDKIVSYKPVYLQQLINDGIIQKSDSDLEYSRDYALKSLAERCEALHLKISKTQVMDCLDTMDSILACLNMGRLPEKSYAIGAENGIGKTTFAITCLKAAAAHNLTVAPYTDMTTLTEKYVTYAKELRNIRENINKGTLKEETKQSDKFSWREYVEADFVVVSLTGGNADIAYIELDTLLTLVTRRSINKRPTIVLMRTPVEYYVQFDTVRKYYIKELFTIKNKQGTLAMLEPHNMFTREPVQTI